MGAGMFDFRSREEKERDYNAFYKRVFPGGEAQKERVTSRLKERVPGEDVKYVLLYYVTLKDYMVLNEEPDIEKAAGQAFKKMRLIKVTPGLLEVFREVMEEEGGPGKQNG